MSTTRRIVSRAVPDLLKGGSDRAGLCSTRVCDVQDNTFGGQNSSEGTQFEPTLNLAKRAISFPARGHRVRKAAASFP